MFDYDEFYKKQPVSFIDFPERHAKIASLCKGKVFDIGCCFGILSDYYFGEYRGYDFVEHCIAEAKKVRRKDAEFCLHDCSDLSALPIEEADTFVFAEFLEHFKDDERILAPIYARHKKGARLVISIPNGPRVPDPSHERELTIPQLRKKFEPHGKVKFYHWPGERHNIIMTVDLDERALNWLSLVMIVKNEEKGLERAIFSALDYVDNIVIACDNSSTDKTKEIAALYADTLKTFDWRDDFSWARNFAHEGVKTKWILFLDGHEYIAKLERLNEFLALDYDGLLCSVELESTFVFQNPRIYKNGVQFEGRVHEKQMCKSVLPYPGILIKHDRIGAQSVAAATERALQTDDMVPRIMGEELRKDPKNIRALFHLAIFYQARGRFKEALPFQKKYLALSKNTGERWFVLLNRALCNLSLSRFFFADYNAKLCEKEIPGRWEVNKLRGLILFMQKKYFRALEYFIKTFEPDKFEYSYKPWAHNDFEIWNLIGECFFNLRQPDKAYSAFARAAEKCAEAKLKGFYSARAALMVELTKAKN